VQRTSRSHAWRRFASFLGGASDVANLSVASCVSLSFAQRHTTWCGPDGAKSSLFGAGTVHRFVSSNHVAGSPQDTVVPPTRGRREYGSSVPRQQAERRRCGFWSHVTATWNGSGHLEEVTWLRGRRFGEGRDVDSRKTNRRPPRRNRCRRVYTIPPVRRWKSRFEEMEAMVVQVEGRRDGGNGWSR